MKKIIILLAVLACGVGEVKAQTFNFGIEIENPTHVKVFRYGGSNEDTWGSETTATDDGLKFGRHWYHVDLNGNTGAIVRFSIDDNDCSDDIENINTSSYYFISEDKKGGSRDDRYNVGTLESPFTWKYLICRNDVAGWDVTDANMVDKGDNTFSYTLSKSDITTRNLTTVYFRLRNGDFIPLNDAGERIRDYPQIYPNVSGATLSIAGNTTSYYQDMTNTEWSWGITVPSYDYKEIVITAKYINEGGSYKWKISADAYVSPTLSYEVATYSVAAPLDFSQATGVKGYYASDADASKVTFTKIDGACAANTGLVLAREGSDPISIPVAASGTDYTSSNKLMAGTGASVNSDGSTNRYVLARNNSTGDIHFAKLASSKEIAVGKAYLELPASPSPAPSLSIFFDDAAGGTTAIDAVKSAEPAVTDGAYYNLAGQRVTNPTKGLYIVNGRKVVVK